MINNQYNIRIEEHQKLFERKRQEADDFKGKFT
jgi:hypothetical protein